MGWYGAVSVACVLYEQSGYGIKDSLHSVGLVLGGHISHVFKAYLHGLGLGGHIPMSSRPTSVGWGWAVISSCLKDLPPGWAVTSPNSQDLPPWAGVGWSQSRSERRTPPPQVREHALQLDDIP